MADIYLHMFWLLSMLVAGFPPVEYEHRYCVGHNKTAWAIEDNAAGAAGNDSRLCEGLYSNRTEILMRGLAELAPPTPINGSLNSLNSLRLRRMFSRLARGQVIHIFVFGGSMTAGRFVKGLAGAWPSDVEWGWNSRSNKTQTGTLKIKNYAFPATSSQWLLHRLGLYFPRTVSCDLVVLDYDFNDSAVWSSNQEDHRNLQAVMEVLVTRLLQMRQGPAILYLEAATSPASKNFIHHYCSEYLPWWQHGQVKRPVMDAYAIPVISQRRASWPEWSCPPSRDLMDCTGVGCAHPSWRAHQLYSDLVQLYLRRGTEAAAARSFDKHHNSMLLASANASDSASDSDGDSDADGTTALLEQELAELQALKGGAYAAQNAAEVDSSSCPLPTMLLDRDSSETALRDFLTSPPVTTRIALLDEQQNETLKDDNAKFNELIRKPVQSSPVPSDYSSSSLWTTLHRDLKTSNLTTPLATSPSAFVNSSSSPPAPVLVSVDGLDGCWRYGEDMKGKEKGWIGEGCVGASLVFAVKFGHLGILTVVHLMTYNTTAGLLQVSVSPPVGVESPFVASSGALSWPDHFDHIGIIDVYHRTDDGFGASLIHPTCFGQHHHARFLHPGAVQLVKFSLVQANSKENGNPKGRDPWTGRHEHQRDPKKSDVVRYPKQKVKITGLSTC